MKPRFFLTAIACLTLASCAHQAAQPPVLPASATDKERLEYERKGREWERERREKATQPPHRGMSREQVRAEYGRPASISSNQRYETWSYSFNGTDSRKDSPFNDTSATVRCTVNFSQLTGKVETWQWLASNPIMMGGNGSNNNNNGGYGRRSY